MNIQSVVLGDVAISPRQFTQADGQQLTQALKLLGDTRFDIYGPGSQHNSDLLLKFFEAHPEVPVSVANIFKAVEERKSDYRWLTHAEHEWFRAAQQNPQLGNDLANYIASTSGRPGSFVKDGDPLFENLLPLFKELQSRRESVTPQAISAAENRIANRPGPKLKYVPQPRRTEPISPAAKADDGKPFIMDGLKKQSDGSYGKSPAQYKAEADAAREAANPKPTEREKVSAEDQQWRRMAEEACNFGTHGSQQAIRETFDRAVGAGMSWRKVFEECNRVVAMYKRSKQISGNFR